LHGRAVHPRCPQAMERCRTELPPRFDLPDGQWAACWLYDGAAANGTAPGADRTAVKEATR
ncbi:ABC transporter ATP-binding protein, partial [Streptomyces sp. MBT98]|nr:ABC transporter ATP-binding protein [Streptomyces sp. MBT98]